MVSVPESAPPDRRHSQSPTAHRRLAAAAVAHMARDPTTPIRRTSSCVRRTGYGMLFRPWGGTRRGLASPAPAVRPPRASFSAISITARLRPIVSTSSSFGIAA